MKINLSIMMNTLFFAVIGFLSMHSELQARELEFLTPVAPSLKVRLPSGCALKEGGTSLYCSTHGDAVREKTSMFETDNTISMLTFSDNHFGKKFYGSRDALYVKNHNDFILKQIVSCKSSSHGNSYDSGVPKRFCYKVDANICWILRSFNPYQDKKLTHVGETLAKQIFDCNVRAYSEISITQLLMLKGCPDDFLSGIPDFIHKNMIVTNAFMTQFCVNKKSYLDHLQLLWGDLKADCRNFNK